MNVQKEIDAVKEYWVEMEDFLRKHSYEGECMTLVVDLQEAFDALEGMADKTIDALERINRQRILMDSKRR